ncbi:hypothetical protein HPP92_017936 [Vanilla planifolia]|uniref:Aminotransferase class I/classII large domain-containing protein n=1 Tax=Vanilla planifolia TaxID=51239 RepID=A0A835UP20_VANPL|nr:hypothetical protein HPP92_017936 [Vanilla planifolia]
MASSTMLSVGRTSPATLRLENPTKFWHAGGRRDGRTWLKRKNSFQVRMAVAVDVSRFEGVTMAPPDPILGVSEAFRADDSDVKLNLGVGAYRTEELQPYVLNVVKKAEKLMLERGENKEYLPIEGLAAFNKVTAQLLFGADNPVIQQGSHCAKSFRNWFSPSCRCIHSKIFPRC